ncbi:methyl-accepting chemotaxis protein [Maridesulfovibrio bastinii]|uniref:methyl-accepting chemotaxis protein n=1 Tax=Maridesulfovibrio bastinii TaxID=47157 RepID=UPI000400AF58|nr:methyl-accepting chemotaxis protein [Maridesulfovibrio bastinii]
MFRSLNARISTIVAVVVILSSLATLFFIENTVQNDMTAAQGKTARNIIRMAILNLQEGQQAMARYRVQAMKDRKQAVKDALMVFESQLDNLYDLYEQGSITKDQAIQSVRSLVHNTRYFNNDYFFVYTEDMVSVAHPDKGIQGRDVSDMTDVKGYAFGKGIKQKAAEGRGSYLTIWWKRLGNDVPIPKILYVKSCKKWNWIIGTGTYVDDIEAQIAAKRTNFIEELKKGFDKVRLAESGRLFIFDDQKNIIVPPKGYSANFQNRINLTTGNTILHDLRETAKKNEWKLDYSVAGANHEIDERVSYVKHFKPLGWYIASIVPKCEIEEPVENLVKKQAAISLIILMVTLALIYYAIKKMCEPIRNVSKMARLVAKGDLRNAGIFFKEVMVNTSYITRAEAGRKICEINTDNKRIDEIGQLVISFHEMITTLNSLVGHVQKSGEMVTGSAVQMGSAINQLEITVEDQATATQELGSTAREISSTANELARTMNDSTEVAIKTAGLAARGFSDLEVMAENMQKMREASTEIFSKLSIINSKAANISTVVTSISKISEQINLLSLNAAIEAEKAGEFGQGFSVVAREIRKLADQTAMSTLDIEKIVAEMTSAVSAGVMGMDKFRQQVESGVSNVEDLGRGIGEVVHQVHSLSPQFETVNEGMQNQSDGAAQISKAILQLSETAVQTRDSLEEFISITEKLTESVSGLEAEISVFKVD